MAAREDLSAQLRRIASLLARHAGDAGAAPDETAGEPRPASDPESSPLALLCSIFGLTPFERDVLLLCAGCELDADCATLVARLQDGGPPTFALALAALPEAHWSALLPTGPLRYWRLVELGAGASLVGSGLRIDERILHALLGLHYLDERLDTLIEIAPRPEPLPSQEALAERIAAAWQDAAARNDAPPLLQLCGADPKLRQDIAATASALVGCALLVVRVGDLPEEQAESERLQRLWEREALLVRGVRMIVDDRTDADAGGDRRLDRLLERAKGALILSSAIPRPAGAPTMLTFEVAMPTPDEHGPPPGKKGLLGPAAAAATKRGGVRRA